MPGWLYLSLFFPVSSLMEPNSFSKIEDKRYEKGLKVGGGNLWQEVSP
jgi:hypothetical protein